MTFVYKQSVHTQLLEGHHVIFPLGGFQLFQPLFQALSGFLHLLDGKPFAYAVLHLRDGSLNLVDLLLDDLLLPLKGEGNLLELRMTDDDRIIVAGGDTGTELLPIGSFKILKIRDYKKNEIKDLKTGDVTETGLPSSNVLYYDLEDDGWCCARPSGTEPKIKFYMGVKGTSLEDAEKKLNDLTENLLALVKE